MKKKGILIVLVILLILAFLFYISVNVYAYLSAKGNLFSLEEGKEDLKKVDAILVLGAGVRKDKTPSHMLEDRLLTALALYESGVSEKIIVSGDHGQVQYDEVGVMKDYLIEKGIPSEQIFMDHAGFSTYDSLCRAKLIFGADSLVVVTQKYHSYRALMIGRHFDLNVKGVCAPILSTNASGYAKQPWYSFRESAARCKDFIWCLFDAKPTFLGEPISLESSGDVTND